MKPNCIIAARSGSTRIPNKNIVNVYKKPLITYAINLSVKSKIFKNVYVSTDCKKIKKISEKCGAKVPQLRSKKLAKDRVGLQEVIVDFIKKNNLENEKYFVFVYATCSLLKKKMLIDAIKKFLNTKSDLLLSLQEFESSPLKAFKIKKNNRIEYYNQKFFKTDTKNLEKLYFHPGSFFIFKTKPFLNKSRNFTKKTTYYLHKKYEVIDVDFKEDLEQMMKLMKINNINV
jgi:pseudaminic acid cytidylyltransferase